MAERELCINLTGIPEVIYGTVKDYALETINGLGDKIVSIAVTGSCITDDYIHGKSDINSVLVLKEMDSSCLDKLASMGRRYGKRRLRAPLIMTCEYIERSLDVFPIEFLDIKLIHKTIFGTDLLTDLSINKSLLRLQCERDLKAKLIHLHQGYISCSGGGRGLRALLLEAYPGFFPLFRAMISIVQINQPPSILKADVLSDVESSFNVSMDALREIKELGLKRGFGLDWGMAKGVFNQIYRITHELSLTMDRLSH